MNKFLTFYLLTQLCSCANDNHVHVPETITNSIDFIEDFDNQTNFEQFWEDASQNNSPENYNLDNGHFVIRTRANIADRVKIKTKRSDFGLGVYTWRIFTEARNIGDQNSIGAFLYLNDNKELDFEIGSGKVNTRSMLNAQPDDLVVYCTSQNLPFVSNPFLIKHNQWHTFKIELSLDDTTQNYKIKWFVDNNLLQAQVLDYGITNTFGVYCNLENLSFIGDQLPTQDYSTLFDYFEFIED